jgi:hypothetical protein
MVDESCGSVSSRESGSCTLNPDLLLAGPSLIPVSEIPIDFTLSAQQEADALDVLIFLVFAGIKPKHSSGQS